MGGDGDKVVMATARRPLDAAITLMGKRLSVAVIDVARDFPTRLLADGIHPNDAGYRLLAAHIATARV